LCGQAANPDLKIAVRDAAGKPVPGVSVKLAAGAGTVRTGETDAGGQLSFTNVGAGQYSLTASKAGFETLEGKRLDLTSAGAAIDLTMTATLTRSDTVEVRGTVMEVEENASIPNTLPPKAARELPNRPATVADALPLTPGVIREPGGTLILSSSPENRSALIVNSADVTDPATGQFGLTIPIDSVEVLNVYQTATWPSMGASRRAWCRWRPGAAATNGSGSSTIHCRSSAFAVIICAG
jgi:Predicted outer membrane protein